MHLVVEDELGTTSLGIDLLHFPITLTANPISCDNRSQPESSVPVRVPQPLRGESSKENISITASSDGQNNKNKLLGCKN